MPTRTASAMSRVGGRQRSATSNGYAKRRAAWVFKNFFQTSRSRLDRGALVDRSKKWIIPYESMTYNIDSDEHCIELILPAPHQVDTTQGTNEQTSGANSGP